MSQGLARRAPSFLGEGTSTGRGLLAEGLNNERC